MLREKLFHVLHFFAHSPLVLLMFCDVDWVNDPTDLKYTTNYYLFLGKSLISWHSKKKIGSSYFSTKAVFFHDGGFLRIWMLLIYPYPSSNDLYYNNQIAI